MPAPRAARAAAAAVFACAGVAAVVVVAPFGIGCAPEGHAGPTVLWSKDAAAEENPVPEERDARDGHLALRDDFAFTFLPKAAWTAAAQTTFDAWETFLVACSGWGVSAPVLLRFDAPLDGAALDAARAVFVVVDGGGETVPARLRWVSDPGFLEARPALPLPASSRILLAVARDVDGGDLARSPDYDALVATDAQAQRDLAAAARALQLGDDTDGVAAVVAYRTGDPAQEFARALDLVKDRVPSFSFAAPVPPAQLPAPYHGQIGRLPDGVLVSIGTFTDVDLRNDDDGLWSLENTDHTATLDVVYAMPDAAQFPPPWPAVIAQHGFNDDRTFGLKVGDAFLARGIAVLAIDASSHGNRGSAFDLFDIADPRVSREHLRQTALDDAQLATLVTSGRLPELDGRVGYFGHSMGTIIAAPLFAFDPRFHSMVLNAPGSSFVDIFTKGQLKTAVGLLLRPALGLGVDDPAYDDALSVSGAILETLMEPADPIAYARLRPPTTPPLLLQMNVGDRTLPNDASRDLAAALAVPTVDVAGEGEDPRDALWIMDGADFGFPADDNPHGLHMFAGAPGIHAQMAEFIRSEGRWVIDPLAH